MFRVLILNPNTSEAVTEKLLAHAKAMSSAPRAAGASVGSGSASVEIEWEAVTANWGARYISDAFGMAVAAIAAIDRYSEYIETSPPPDAIVLACFGDPGLEALAAWSGRPVFGLAESAFAQLAENGPFVVVTGGRAWGPILTDLAARLGYANSIAAIQTLDSSGMDLMSDPEGACRALAACAMPHLQGAVCGGLQPAVLLGGAGVFSMAAGVKAQLDEALDGPVTVVDSVSLTLQRVMERARSGGFAASEPLRPQPHDYRGLPAATQTLCQFRGGR